MRPSPVDVARGDAGGVVLVAERAPPELVGVGLAEAPVAVVTNRRLEPRRTGPAGRRRSRSAVATPNPSTSSRQPGRRGDVVELEVAAVAEQHARSTRQAVLDENRSSRPSAS